MEQKILKVDVVKIVENIFQYAVKQGASDIHLEPQEHNVIIRYRIDGVLKVVEKTDYSIFELILGRIKILASLETTGRPRPQEGRIKFHYETRDVDFRVSIFPTTYGECVVMRTLESQEVFSDFTDLGMTTEQSRIVRESIRRPYGLVLVTGPNGTGKSTTLFTVLNMLNDPAKSLVTLEDPVERRIEMVRQTQIDPDIGLTFASGLRYLLRQDPDIIMVGEIRDRETAQIAVQAAITGHLVIASVHTNDAAGAIVRLINMGVEPFLLSTSLKLVTAQRLARLICPDCKRQIEPAPELVKKIGAPQGMRFFQAVGCQTCDGRGTKGRIGMHEVLVITREIQDLILNQPSDSQINEIARKNGMLNLREAAFQKVHEGAISIEEALRLTEQ